MAPVVASSLGAPDSRERSGELEAAAAY